jgi:tetratricopeptide (TPR) repeat protein
MRAILALAAGVAIAVALSPANAQERRNIFADPQNLQVLPADISPGELSQIMRDNALGLGVRCQYCHVGEEGQSLLEFDFAADVKETKAIAREMFKMVANINATTAAIATRMEREPTEVTCVTCHRGQSRPRLIEDVLNETLDSGDGAAAAEKYRALREQFYGSHTYDFSALTLTMYASALLRGPKQDAGIVLLELNRDYHPDSFRIHGTLGQGYEMAGELEKAVESYRKALEFRPGWAAAERRIKALEEKMAAEKPE